MLSVVIIYIDYTVVLPSQQPEYSPKNSLLVALRAVNISMYKLIITAGCSFSESHCWPGALADYIGSDHCEFQHYAVSGQGNELIQKKVTSAVIRALQRFQPEEIAVFVMWSSVDRRGFHISDLGRELIARNSDRRSALQFTDLSGQLVEGSGWYHCQISRMDNHITKTYYNFLHSTASAVHVTLENILLLNLLLERSRIFNRQMVIMSQIIDDLTEFQTSEIAGHLFASIDWTQFDLIGEYDYLKAQADPGQYFTEDQWHPNARGHELWFEQRLLPWLTGHQSHGHDQ